jgi:hypothetical protein
MEVVGGRVEGQASGDQDGFVTGAADLEVDAVLSLEGDLAVVEPAGQNHVPVSADEVGRDERVHGTGHGERSTRKSRADATARAGATFRTSASPGFW